MLNEKAKIELILVPSETPYADPGFFDYSPVPLSLGVLCSYLKEEGYMVHGTDLNTKMKKNVIERGNQWWRSLLDYDQVISHLRNGSPTGLEEELDWFLEETNYKENEIIGIAMGANMSFFEIHIALLLGKRLQKLHNKTVIFGGGNVEFLWQFREVFAELWDVLLENFSFFIIGPGEKVLAEIIAGINGDKNARSYKELPGVIYRDNGLLSKNIEDYPSFICPDFSELELDHYKMCCYKEKNKNSLELNILNYYKWPIYISTKVSERNRRTLPKEKKEEKLFISYYFNSNCSYKCAFCVQSREDALPPKCKQGGEVVNDLEFLSKNYDSKYFRFYNNAFNFSPSFVKDFCQEVITRNLEIYWSDCARFNNLNKDLVEMMYKAGCRKLVFGLDSASEKIAELIDKRIDFDHVREVLKWCKQFGIWVEVEVITGLPYEREEEFLETYNFLKLNLEKGLITGFHLNSYYIVPDSLLGKYPEKYGIEIISANDGYKNMLERSSAILEVLTAENGEAIKSPLYAYRAFSFNELNGRMAEDIILETEDKFRRLRGLLVSVSR